MGMYLTATTVLACFCCLQASDGTDAWRRKADLLLKQTAEAKTVGAFHAARGSSLAAHQQQLKQARTSTSMRYSFTSMLQESGGNSSAADNIAAAAAGAGANSSAASNGSADSGASDGGCNHEGGLGTTFECWLASYKDPEDLEDWMTEHRASHTFSHAKWYADHANYSRSSDDWYADHKNMSAWGGVNSEEWFAAENNKTAYAGLNFHSWYAARKNYSAHAGINFASWYAEKKNMSERGGVDQATWWGNHKDAGNFSWGDWVSSHGLHSEMKANRMEMLAQLSSRLDGYTTTQERCGLECWMAQFRHRDQLAAVHNWFKNTRGNTRQALEQLDFEMLQTEAWYQTHKVRAYPAITASLEESIAWKITYCVVFCIVNLAVC